MEGGEGSSSGTCTSEFVKFEEEKNFKMEISTRNQILKIFRTYRWSFSYFRFPPNYSSISTAPKVDMGFDLDATNNLCLIGAFCAVKLQKLCSLLFIGIQKTIL